MTSTNYCQEKEQWLRIIKEIFKEEVAQNLTSEDGLRIKRVS